MGPEAVVVLSLTCNLDPGSAPWRARDAEISGSHILLNWQHHHKYAVVGRKPWTSQFYYSDTMASISGLNRIPSKGRLGSILGVLTLAHMDHCWFLQPICWINDWTVQTSFIARAQGS